MLSPQFVSSLQIAFTVMSLALIVGTIAAGLNGSAGLIGRPVRLALEGPLGRIRSGSDQSRGDLAGMSLTLAAVLAASAIVVEQSIMTGLLGVLLWWMRPQIAQMLADEHPLMAEARSPMFDLMIGLFTPLAVAHLLVGDFMMAWTLALVTVSLSWPVAESRPGRLAGFGS